MDQKLPEYDVTLSFAGEDRDYVDQVTSALKKMGLRVFYDKDEAVTLWGEDLYTQFEDVYFRRSKYVVVFLSKHYKNKLWASHELKNAQARAFLEKRAYILPARFDDTEIPGILPTVGYIDLNGLSPKKLAEMVRQKLESSGPSATTQEAQKPESRVDLASAPMPSIKRKPTDKQRSDFLYQAFAVIRSYLEEALQQLAATRPDIETEFRPVTNNKFVCEVYLNGELRGRCKIWIGGFTSPDSSINYAEGRFRIENDNSYNEVLHVESDGFELFLKPLINHSYGSSQSRLTPQQAAEHLWKRLTHPLQY
jgi:hypothetical protein